LSLKFYMDHNVHAGITDGLRNRGVDCLTAQEDGKASAADPDILLRAFQLGCVVFTQDVDFLGITKEWINSKREFGGVIYARQMGITIGQAIRDLELFAKTLEPEEMRNSLQWIPLT
jgi:hypothetical protein